MSSIWIDLRSFLVVDKTQNTKLVEFRVLYFVRSILYFVAFDRSIVVVDRRQNRLEICVFNFVSLFCPATKNTKSRQNSFTILSFGPVLSRDKIQNTKLEIRPVLYFVFCRPLGTMDSSGTSYLYVGGVRPSIGWVLRSPCLS